MTRVAGLFWSELIVALFMAFLCQFLKDAGMEVNLSVIIALALDVLRKLPSVIVVLEFRFVEWN